MATRTRPAVRPEALREAAAFPTLEAIFTRRARRFALGAELTGPLAFRSEKEPVPLAYEEEAILVAAATGVTGVVAEEWPFLTEEGGPTGADKLATFTGRAYPSPLAQHGTELFWTNDDGVFVLPQRDARPDSYVENQTFEAQHALYGEAIKLQDGRLDIPRRRPNLFRFNEWIVNTRGLDGLHTRSRTSRGSASRRCSSTSTARTATTSSTGSSATTRCGRS